MRRLNPAQQAPARHNNFVYAWTLPELFHSIPCCKKVKTD
ncbi:hypothetical protein SFMTTN_0210 [Sulfuriferula multivorans]|uniref:Uncharacterized protein n=1 Tax=Sulfuriferula multivorans TaxID=1559896 RepID=A0A401J9R2_9PROT|nr:hypothetical protein SFMTTN_0210 [Sulfuriferula multivorans]